MKPITKYLNTKSQWHPEKSFPIDPTWDNVIEFLQSKGFYELKFHNEGFYTEYMDNMINELNKKKGRSYITADLTTYKVIRFCDTTNKEICEENPIFLCRVEGERDKTCSLEKQHGLVVDSPIKYDEFAEIANKHFGW